MLTPSRLFEVLNYSPDTGAFSWKNPTSYIARKRETAGTASGSRGYSVIHIDRKAYYAHRLAWLYYHGTWPACQVDHINGIRRDNRISNLREATVSQNNANMRARGSKLKGTSFDKRDKRWGAQITKDYKCIYLGRFDTEQEAHETYVAAAKHHHGEFARAA